MALLVDSAQAHCNRSVLFGRSNISISVANLPENILIESRSYPPGEIIYSSGWITGSNNKLTISNCTRNYTVGYFYLNSPQVEAGTGRSVMPTNINGLGVRVSAMNQAGPYDSALVIDNDWHPGNGTSENHTLLGSAYMIELVASGGPISSGQLSFGSPIAHVEFRESESHGAPGAIASELRLSSTMVVMKAMGCEADVSTITFPFGSISVTAFDGILKAGSAPLQTINLACEPGTNVSLSVNAAEAKGDNANHTVIALTDEGSSGVAGGVGVQLGLKSQSYDSGNNGLPLNTPIPILTSTRSGSSYLSGGAAAQETLSFSAIYYRTLTQVTPGVANARATLTLTYN